MDGSTIVTLVVAFIGLLAPVVTYLIRRDQKSDERNKKLLDAALAKCEEGQERSARELRDVKSQLRDTHERYYEVNCTITTRIAEALEAVAERHSKTFAKKLKHDSDRIRALSRNPTPREIDREP